jgi:hypothetical protein
VRGRTQRVRLASTVIGVVSALLAFSGGSALGASPQNTWVGDWSTSYGPMTIEAGGRGHYDCGQGTIEGSASGATFSGTWKQKSSCGATLEFKGRFEFEFKKLKDGTLNAREFEGKWRYETANGGEWSTTPWNGTCTSGNCLKNSTGATTTPPSGGQGTRGSTRVCVGGCSNAQFSFDPTIGVGQRGAEVGIGCGGVRPPRVTSSAARRQQGGSCDIAALTKVDRAQVMTITGQIEADRLKQQMERWKLLREQAKIFEIQHDVTVNKARTAGRAFNKFDEYIRDSSAPADTKALKATDKALDSQFRPKGVRVPSSPAADDSLASMPSASLVLRSIYEARPTAADIAAYDAALKLATSATYSPARAHARLTLLVALVVGRPVLQLDVAQALGAGKALTVGSARANVPAHGTRKLKVGSSALGGRVLRLLTLIGLSHPTAATLEIRVTRGGKSATHTKTLKIG